MKQTAKENHLHNIFIPPTDYLDNFHFNELIETEKKIKSQKTLLLEKSQDLEETEKKLKFITSISLCLSSTLDYNRLLTRLFNELAAVTGVDALSVSINHKQASKTSIVSSQRFNSSVKREIAKQAMNNFVLLPENTISKTNRRADFLYSPTIVYNNPGKQPLMKILPESFYSISGNLKIGREIIGTVWLHKFKQGFSKSQTDLFLSILDQVALTLTNSIRYKKFRKLASRDSLTGMLNRRVFDDIFKREYKRAVRYSSPLSIIFIDIDHFKRINDGFGHLAGDNVLKKFSFLIQKCIRETDVLARYGGEEFVLLLPETSRELAFKTAERIRIKLENNIFFHNNVPFHVTASMGVSSLEYKKNIKGTPEEVLNHADCALYKAKSRGRNQVVSAE